jgi:hypothetical protein
MYCSRLQITYTWYHEAEIQDQTPKIIIIITITLSLASLRLYHETMPKLEIQPAGQIEGPSRYAPPSARLRRRWC